MAKEIIDKYTVRRDLVTEIKSFIAKIQDPLGEGKGEVQHEFDPEKVKKIVNPLRTALNHIAQVDLFEV